MASSIDSINKALTAATKLGQIATKVASLKKTATPQYSKKEIEKLANQRAKELIEENKAEQSYQNLAKIRGIVKAVKSNDYEQLSIITGLSMEDCITLLKI
jgi:hypothetical protein